MIKFKLVYLKSALIGAVLCLAAAMTVGCRKKEAVITDNGQDIVQPVKQYESLEASDAKKFGQSDLTIGNLKCFDTEDQVVAYYGEPKKVVALESGVMDETKSGSSDNMQDKAYIYQDKTMTFSYIDGVYKLTSVESRSSADIFSRGLSVGMTFDDILSVYYRDADCMNNTYYSEDKTVMLGKYLYGNYTLDTLSSVKPSGKVEYGVIIFNGFATLEEADNYIVEMTYFEPPYKNGTASVEDDFLQIAFDIDKSGKITSVRWYYYPEE